MVSDIYVMQGYYLWGRSAPVKSTDTSQLMESMTGQYRWASNLLNNLLSFIYSIGAQIIKIILGFH